MAFPLLSLGSSGAAVAADVVMDGRGIGDFRLEF